MSGNPGTPIERPADTSADEYEILSPREESAARALKSALIGLFLLPLQIYTAWLLLSVTAGSGTLRARFFWYAVIAAMIMIPDVVISSALLVGLILSPETFLYGPIPPP